jgi:hypothetical protein
MGGSIAFGIMHYLLASRYGKMKAAFYLIHMGSSTLKTVKNWLESKTGPKKWWVFHD